MSDWTPLPDIGEPVDELVVRDLDLVDDLTHPLRGALLHRLRSPHSAAELAEAMGVPVTRLYHHLHRLEEVGLIRAVATRRSGAKTERRYGVTARSVRVDRAAVHGRPAGDVARAVGLLFDVAKQEFRHEVEQGAIDPDHLEAVGGLALLEVAVTPERQAELVARLHQVIVEFGGMASDSTPDARRMRLLIAGYPLSD